MPSPSTPELNIEVIILIFKMKIDKNHDLEEIFRFKPKIFPPKKISKKNKVVKNELKKEEVASLLEQTNYTEEEIQSWFTKFQKECPRGVLSRKKVVHQSLKTINRVVPQMTKIFEKLGKPRPSNLANNILSIFDR